MNQADQVDQVDLRILPEDVRRHIASFCGQRIPINRIEILAAIGRRLIRRSARLRYSWIALYAASVRISQMEELYQ